MDNPAPNCTNVPEQSHVNAKDCLRAIQVVAYNLRKRSKLRTQDHTDIDVDRLPTVDDILHMFEQQNGCCFYCHIPLVVDGPSKYPDGLSVDRLDVQEAYAVENIVLCCVFCNYGRNVCHPKLYSTVMRAMFGDLDEYASNHRQISYLIWSPKLAQSFYNRTSTNATTATENMTSTEICQMAARQSHQCGISGLRFCYCNETCCPLRPSLFCTEDDPNKKHDKGNYLLSCLLLGHARRSLTVEQLLESLSIRKASYLSGPIDSQPPPWSRMVIETRSGIDDIDIKGPPEFANILPQKFGFLWNKDLVVPRPINQHVEVIASIRKRLAELKLATTGNKSDKECFKCGKKNCLLYNGYGFRCFECQEIWKAETARAASQSNANTYPDVPVDIQSVQTGAVRHKTQDEPGINCQKEWTRKLKREHMQRVAAEKKSKDESDMKELVCTDCGFCGLEKDFYSSNKCTNCRAKYLKEYKTTRPKEPSRSKSINATHWTCNGCQVHMPVDQFSATKLYKTSTCKECKRVKQVQATRSYRDNKGPPTKKVRLTHYCVNCEQELPIELFPGQSKPRKDAKCKSCISEKTKAYNKEQRAKRKQLLN